jgi:TPR repeat protein
MTANEIDRVHELLAANALEEARTVLEELVARGLPEAQGLLGLMCFLGQGGATDEVRAVALLSAAAAAGVGTAAHNLGTLLSVGAPGVPADCERAAEAYARARSLGVQAAPEAFYRSGKS